MFSKERDHNIKKRAEFHTLALVASMLLIINSKNSSNSVTNAIVLKCCSSCYQRYALCASNFYHQTQKWLPYSVSRTKGHPSFSLLRHGGQVGTGCGTINVKNRPKSGPNIPTWSFAAFSFFQLILRRSEDFGRGGQTSQKNNFCRIFTFPADFEGVGRFWSRTSLRPKSSDPLKIS